MNLQTKLDNSLNDILKTSGYIFEIINNNKKQSNLITGSNNQLITPTITSQLATSIAKFDEILDDTLSKFNDARWCIEMILENKQKQEELKLKEELEKQKKLKEEEERKRQEEEEALKKEEAVRKRKAEEEAEAKAEAERAAARLEKQKQDEERKAKDEQLKKQQQEEEEKKRKEEERRREDIQQPTDFNDFMSPVFDFSMGDLGNNNEKAAGGIPNPSDILSGIDYTDDPLLQGNVDPARQQNNNDSNKDSGDLDMNNLLGNDELNLDGLNMGLLDQRFDDANSSQLPNDDEFDVDNFLNQFGGTD